MFLCPTCRAEVTKAIQDTIDDKRKGAASRRIAVEDLPLNERVRRKAIQADTGLGHRVAEQSLQH